MPVPGNVQRIGQIRRRCHGDALPGQAVHHHFLIHPVLLAADAGGMLLKKIRRHLLRDRVAELAGPPFHQPHGQGIPDGQILQGIFLPVRPHNPVLLPGNGPQYPVYKSLEAVKPFFLSQLHRLVASGGIRHSIHEQQLINGAAQNVADHRLHFLCFHRGIPVDHIVDPDSVLDGSLADPVDESPLLPGQILHFVQGVADSQVAVLPIPVDLQQNLQNNFPNLRTLSHDLFLLPE